MQKLPSILDQCMLVCISDSSCSRAENTPKRVIKKGQGKTACNGVISAYVNITRIVEQNGWMQEYYTIFFEAWVI